MPTPLPSIRYLEPPVLAMMHKPRPVFLDFVILVLWYLVSAGLEQLQHHPMANSTAVVSNLRLMIENFNKVGSSPRNTDLSNPSPVRCLDLYPVSRL